jgi:hypothetical protein
MSSASMIAVTRAKRRCVTRATLQFRYCALRNIIFRSIDLGTPSAKGALPMFDLMVYAVLFFGFPLGVLVGYEWRDRISRERRARYLAERGSAKIRNPGPG